MSIKNSREACARFSQDLLSKIDRQHHAVIPPLQEHVEEIEALALAQFGTGHVLVKHSLRSKPRLYPLIWLLFGIAVWAAASPPYNQKDIQRAQHDLEKIWRPIRPLPAPVWPDPNKPPATGEVIAGHPITSPWGARKQPCVGCSKFHRGVDIGTPFGTPVRAIGKPGEKIQVKCRYDPAGGGTYSIQTAPSFPGLSFESLHLSKCIPGKYQAGTVIGLTGTAGTGPHLHFQMRHLKKRDAYNGLFAPPRWAIKAVLSGSLPKVPLKLGR